MQEWLNQLEELPGKSRDAQIIQAVEDGLAVFDWCSVSSSVPGHEATFYALSDAAYVPLDDGSRFRFPVTAKLAQQIADMTETMLPTAKLMDLRHQQATNKLNATLLTAGPQMSTTSYSKLWNQKLEAKRQDYQGILSDIGKPWILDNALAASAGACLYGFYDTSAPFTNSIGLKLWQNIGTKHNKEHTDYSSTCLLIKKTCLLDGQETEVAELAKHPTLSKLINYSGPLKFLNL